VSPARRRSVQRIALGALSVGVIAATFLYFLPTVADYRDVWAVVQDLSWAWVAVLAGAAVLNVATFAPPWMVALPGLSFVQAIVVTQVSTALSIVVPAGLAAGVATSFGMLRSWGFATRRVTRAVTLTSLWNQFLNLSFPVVAIFLLAVSGGDTAVLAVAAFVGAAVLGVAVAGFVVVLLSDRLAGDIGDVAARLASWALGKVRRGPVKWGGPSFERFRSDAGELLHRRWHALTAASLVGSLSVFLVLVLSLRALDVPASEVSLVEAFAAWSLVRLIGTIPITPGGIGIVELGLTGALIGFGGGNASVVAAVLVYRFLTMVPTLLVGLGSALTWRRYRPAVVDEAPTPDHPVGTM
jgi:putative heme transporter